MFNVLVNHVCDASNNGGCEHICSEDGDDALCSCEAGYELDTDLKSCAPAQGEHRLNLMYNLYFVF